MTRRFRPSPWLALVLVSACGGGSMRVLSPLVPTPDSALPHEPPTTTVAPAEIPWPTPQEHVLANGLRVLVVERPDSPTVSLRLRVLGAGESGAPADASVPALVGMMLRRGVLDADRGEITWPSSEVTSDATYSVALDFAEIRYRLDVDRVADGIAAIARETMHPAFDPEWFELEQDQQLGSVDSDGADPVQIALARLVDASFGAGSPLGRSTYGTRQAVLAATPARLAAYHRGHYGPDRSLLVVAGPVDAATVFAHAERSFGAWTRVGEPPAPHAVSISADGDRLAILDARTDHALVLHAIPYRLATEEDHAAVDLLDSMYGGVFDSWLNLALREDDGSLYGASASPIGTADAGILVTSVSVSLDDVERVVRRLDSVAARLAEGRVDEHELALARRQEVAGMIRRVVTVDGATAVLASSISSGEGGVDVLRRRFDRMLEATPADLAAAAQRIFDVANTRLVVVGPRSVVADAVRRARPTGP